MFHLSAANNDVRLLDFAIRQREHSNLEIKTDEGWTPAQHAGFMASFDALNLLLENGADINSTNRSGLSLFDHIVNADHVDLLEILWNEALAYDKSRDTKRVASAGLVH